MSNAAVNPGAGPLADTPPDVIDKILDINIKVGRIYAHLLVGCGFMRQAHMRGCLSFTPCPAAPHPFWPCRPLHSLRHASPTPKLPPFYLPISTIVRPFFPLPTCRRAAGAAPPSPPSRLDPPHTAPPGPTRSCCRFTPCRLRCCWCRRRFPTCCSGRGPPSCWCRPSQPSGGWGASRSWRCDVVCTMRALAALHCNKDTHG